MAAVVFAGWLLLPVFRGGAAAPGTSERSMDLEAAFLGALRRQALVLGPAALAAGVLVYFILAFFTRGGQVGAVQAGAAFLAGVFFQTLAGFAAARIFFGCALRTAAAAKISAAGSFTLGLRVSGASAIITLALDLAGMGAVFLLVGGWDDPGSAPLKIAAFCFGSAFSALFARLAGGSYMEAAYAPGGAALAGHGAMNSVNLGADIFDSAATGTLAATILGSALRPVYGPKAVYLPLFALAWGLVSCAAGIMSARPSAEGDHVGALDKGLAAAGITALAGLFLGCCLGLDCNMWLFMATVIGVVSACLFTVATRYYCGRDHYPSRMVAEAASGGTAAAVIRALSSGFESAAAPAVLAGAAVLGSYYCGVRGLEYYGVSGGFTERTCGLYGVAAFVAGMLSVSGYILGMGVFGALSGSARLLNGAAEQEEAVKLNTGAVAASGRTALAAADGYAGAAAISASILLFFGYLFRTSSLLDRPFETVNFAGAEGFAGGLLGAMLVFLFCAYCLRAGAVPAAAAMADTKAFSSSVLKRLSVPAALALALPPASVLVFRRSGLSPEMLSAMLISAAVSGALMSAFIRNAASSLENSLAFIEEGGEGGPEGESYKAVAEGYRAGIALKDTAAPALNVLIKLLPAMALTLAGFFI